MLHSPDDARRLLCELGDHVRDAVVGARGMDMAAIEGETAADTIYAIDRVADDALLDWFEQHWPDVEVVSEGLEEPVVVGRDPTWTRDRRHHRRHARADVRQARRLVPRRRRAARRSLARRRRRRDDRAADRQAGRRRPAQRDPRAAASWPSGSISATAPRTPLDRPTVGGHRPRARVRRARQVLRAGQAGAGRARGRAVPPARVPRTCSTTSTSRRAGSSTS